MKDLPPVLIIETLKIASTHPFLWLIDLVLPDDSDTFRFAHNTEDITYLGNLYRKAGFQIELPSSQAKGQIPTWTLRVPNANWMLEPYLWQYRGLNGAKVKLRIVNAGYLDVDHSELEVDLEVIKGKSNDKWAIFTLGGPNFLNRIFPAIRYLANHCPWLKVGGFKGAECAFTSMARNHGFDDESPLTPTHWQWWGSVEIVSGGHSGNCAKFTADAAPGSLFSDLCQQLPRLAGYGTLPGKEHRVGVRVKQGDASAGQLRVGTTMGGGTLLTVDFLAGAQWGEIFGTFTGTGEKVWITLRNPNPGHYLYFDTVLVEPVGFSCDGRIDTCRSLNNSRRFGGKLGLSQIGVRLV